MTRRNSLQTIHEPFGDAFYFGPERMGSRFENDEKAREESGFADSTFKTIIDRIESEASQVSYFTNAIRRMAAIVLLHFPLSSYLFFATEMEPSRYATVIFVSPPVALDHRNCLEIFQTISSLILYSSNDVFR